MNSSSLTRATRLTDFVRVHLRHLSKTLWHHPLRNYVIIGLLIKIPLALFSGWSDTTKFWHMWNELHANPEAMLTFYPPPWLLIMNTLFRGLSVFYDPSNFAVVEFALAEPWYLVGINQLYITAPIFNFTLKLPVLIGDLMVGLLLYHIVKERSSLSSAKKAFLFWYLNPFVILTASVVGQNDVLVALFMLVSLYLVVKHEYVYSGASLGLSILFKLYNIYVLPFFLLMVALDINRRSERVSHYFKSTGIKNALRFLSGASIPFLLLIPSFLVFGYLLESWIGVPRLAGFNIWGVVTLLPPAYGIANWAYSSFFSLQTVLTLVGLGSALFFSVWITLKLRVDSFQKLVYGIIVIMTVTFLTLTLTNPHQIVSMFPFLVLVAILYRKWGIRYWGLSLAGFGFIVLMRGPYVLFLALGEFTPVISIENLSQLTISWGTMSGILNKFLNHDFMLVSSTLGFVILISFLVSWLRANIHRGREAD